MNTLRLKSKMITKTRVNDELILFPDIPFWFVAEVGSSQLLSKVQNRTIEQIEVITNEQEFEFIRSMMEFGLLVDNDGIANGMELDKKIFPLISVWLNVTSLCNLKCRHCFLGDQSQKEKTKLLSVEQISSLVEEFILVKGNQPIALDITGGEPLLRKDILEIIRVCNKPGIKVSIPTNGLLLNKEMINAIAHEKVALSISLDGSTAEEHEFLRGKDTFKKTLSNILEAQNEGIDVTVIYTIHQGNQGKVLDFLQFCKKMNIKRVNYSFLNSVGNAFTNNLHTADEVSVLRQTLEAALQDDAIMSLLQGSNCARAIEKVAIPLKFDCCGTGINTCAIGADGEVYPCPSFQDKRFSAGNITSMQFSKLWNNPNTFQSFRNIRVDSLSKKCAQCEVRYFCGGECRADATNGGQKPLNSLSPKCRMSKETIYTLMWLLCDNPQLLDLRTSAWDYL